MPSTSIYQQLLHDYQRILLRRLEPSSSGLTGREARGVITDHLVDAMQMRMSAEELAQRSITGSSTRSGTLSTPLHVVDSLRWDVPSSLPTHPVWTAPEPSFKQASQKWSSQRQARISTSDGSKT